VLLSIGFDNEALQIVKQ